MSPRLVLASASQSRRALLAAAGLAFAVQPADVDEAAVKRAALAEGTDAGTAALRLAELKAAAVSRKQPDSLVIGADQILVCGADWFDKPVDLTSAQEQLRALRGRRHTLETAVACYRDGARTWCHVESPALRMRAFSDAFLDEYLAGETASVTTTVGAYRLEGRGIQLFEAIEGDYFAVLGLPLLPLLQYLREVSVLPG